MKRIAIPGLILSLFFAGACSVSSNDSSAPTSAEGAAAPALQYGSGTDQNAKGAPEAPGEADSTAKNSSVGRALIYRGDITLRVDDVEVAAAKVEALAASLNGHLASQKRTLGSQSAYASMTIRIPSDSFASAMQRLSKEVGREESRSSTTDDVTEAVIDLDTRIAAAKASVEAVRKLLGERQGAAPLSEIVMLEKELDARQVNLATLEAKKRSMSDLVALSTITVNIAGPNTQLPEKPKERSPGFLGGLETGWDAFLDLGSALIYTIGVLLPFLVVIAIVAFGLIYGLRYRRARHAIPQSPPSTND